MDDQDSYARMPFQQWNVSKYGSCVDASIVELISPELVRSLSSIPSESLLQVGDAAQISVQVHVRVKNVADPTIVVSVDKGEGEAMARVLERADLLFLRPISFSSHQQTFLMESNSSRDVEQQKTKMAASPLRPKPQGGGDVNPSSPAEAPPRNYYRSREMEEAQSSPRGAQIIEVDMDIAEGVSVPGGKKICGGTACDFNDLKDAKERQASMRKLVMAVALCILFMTVEVIGGIQANSLAIMTDAAHLLSDVAAFAISLFSLWAAGWEATPRQSYGFFRVEIIGALVSIQLIWLLAGILVYEAISRIVHESGEVKGFLMFAVSAFGLLVNIIMAVMLGHDHGHGHGHGGGHSHDSDDDHHDHDHDHDHGHGHAHSHTHSVSITTHHHSGEDKDKHECEGQQQPLLNETKTKKKRNINVHSAYLHVLGDSIQSVGVMVGGAVIWYKPEWKIIDLICTLFFSVIVLLTTINMLRNILEVLMESTPREIDATRLEQGLCEMDGVIAIHELHIWAITVGKVLLACHVTISPNADADHVLDKVIGYIKREYNISHVTIQIERE